MIGGLAIAESNRRFLDRALKVLVSIGGTTALGAIALIFFYLLYAVFPAFLSSEIHSLGAFAAPERTPLLLDVSESDEIAMRIADDGVIEFFDTREHETIASFTFARNLVRAVKVSPTLDTYLVADQSDNLWLARVRYEAVFSGSTRTVEPHVELITERSIPAPGASVAALDALAVDEEIVIAYIHENQIELITYSGNEVSRRSIQHNRGVKNIHFGPRAQWIYLLEPGGHLEVLSTQGSGASIFRTPLVSTNNAVAVSKPLLGRYSYVVGDQRGNVTQWSAIQDELGFRMHPLRSSQLDARPTLILPEPRRKGFATLDEEGGLSLFYPANPNPLTTSATYLLAPTAVAVSPKADRLIAAIAPDRLELFELQNPHPEVSIASLWGEIWYEGYREPVYSWQSSSADNDFEPKFSLTPLLLGTIKAAFYALIVAVPFAIMGAIYTAYFMTPQLREWIKPGVEIMAALPTVILGFIGGLWLAPMIETNLSSVLTVFVLAPLLLVAAALIWPLISKKSRGHTEQYLFISVPILLFSTVVAFQVGPFFENVFFGGNSTRWLDEVLGLDYVQRNALVVGLMMGLAVIPTIFSITEDAVYGVPRQLVNGSLALGATQWQTLTRVVLLTAAPGIFSAVMVGIGRAVGETMIVLMATGNTHITDFNIFEGMRTFAANIAVELPESEVNSSHFRILFLTALVLFVITFFFNTAAEIVRERLRSRYGDL